MKYIKLIGDTYVGYFNYLLGEVLHPHLHNYFYWLILISLAAWGLEWAFPWRKEQKLIREDFWLDAFYMFFNFFLLSLIGFAAITNVFAAIFNDALAKIGITNLALITEKTLPYWLHFAIFFLIKDLIHFNVHRLLHRVPFLWEFHKVHHSVKQMGFAAHLRYHWMENVVYKTIQYVPLAMLGYGLQDFFIADIIAISIGHLNHANVQVPMGPLKYLLNHPQMHLWHHAKKIPNQYGINFGISLSIWDYLFGTVYYPSEDAEVELGFPEDESFPKDFVHQELYPFGEGK